MADQGSREAVLASFPEDDLDDDWRPPRLTTERLILRALDRDDVHGLYAYARDPEVVRHLLWEVHQNLDDTHEFLDKVFEAYRRRMPDPLGITLKDQPDFVIGTAGARWISFDHKTMELGYVVARPHWGQGYATEAVWAVTCSVFSLYPVERLQARVFPGNPGSRRILEKLGFQCEGCLRASVWRLERAWDLEMFSLLRGEWEERVASLI